MISSLLIFLVAGLVGTVEVRAQPGGLIDGVTIYDDLGKPTNAVTDNDVGTFIRLNQPSQPAPHNLIIELPRIASLNSMHHYKSGSGAISITFYDDQGNQVYVDSNIGAGQFNKPLSLQNVKKIVIRNTGVDYANMREFEIFGEYDFRIPQNFTGVSDEEKVQLSWSAITGDPELLGYNLYQDGIKVNTNVITNRSYILAVPPDVLHDYYLTAVYDRAGVIKESKPTNIVSVMSYKQRFNNPVLTGRSSPDTITLNWDDIGSNVHYNLYDAATGQVLVANIQGFTRTFTGLPPGTEYSYYILATDEYGREYNSNSLTLKTVQPPPPELPVLKTVNVTYDSIVLDWQDLKAPYTLLMNGQTVSSTIPLSSFNAGFLQADTDYTFIVSYTDDYGRLVESSPYVVRTFPLPPPVVPVLKSGSVTDSSVRLTWNQTGVSYQVFQNGQKVGDTNSTLYPVYSLTELTPYSFYVVALDRYGRETQSNVVSITTLQTPAPTPPPSPRPPPPPVSGSNNPDLNKANDLLVEGAKDSKNSALTIIMLIIAILVMVFGSMWLVKIFRKKMNKSTGKKDLPDQKLILSSSIKASNLTQKNYSPQRGQRSNYNVQNNRGKNRKRYYKK